MVKRLEIVPIACAVALSAALSVGCSSGTVDTQEAEQRSAAEVASGTAPVEDTADVPFPEGKVYHRRAIGEMVDIHGIQVTVTSAKNGPKSVDGKATYVVHVKLKAVDDPSAYSAEGTGIYPLDFALESAGGERSSEIATVGAAVLGDVTLRDGDEAEGDIYLLKMGDVAKVVYTPSFFDWYPEVTTWQVK